MPQIIMDQPAPQAGVSTSSPFDTRVPEVESWIENLPLVNIGETYRLVFNALTKINDTDLAIQHRFKVLELFRRPVRYLNDAFNQSFLGASFPLPPKAKLSAALLHDLQLEVANGYQRISDELLNLNSLRQDFTMLATSLHRALNYLAQGLLTDYQLYTPVIPGRWRNIHLLYEAAERKGVQLSVVKDPYRQDKQATTIQEQYKQILLFTLANPNRYPLPDMAIIYTLLGQCASHCRLSPADSFNELPDTCIIDLASDEPPSYLAHTAVSHRPACLLLDTAELMQFLQNLLPQSPAEFPKQSPGPLGPETTTPRKDILQSLIAALSLATKRRFSRSPREIDTAEVAFGLSASHRLLDDRLPSANKHAAKDVQYISSRNVQGIASTGAATATDGTAGYFCKVRNESASGACLKWDNAEMSKFRVGELLALRRTRQSGHNWEIAAIRWLKNTGDSTMEFGIQLLSPNAIPVTIRLDNDGHAERDHDYLKGLYIPELKAARQPTSLIVPAFLYHAGDMVSLIIDHQEHSIRLVKSIESTPSFSRFLFDSTAILRNPQAVSAISASM